ncbi:hypothetical protein AGOR_G00198340 [Albula goreensis]|uniref:Uncharacterized protein n=1 Tax=Albula goreensis TaxID=1534307 RepID=A0A8T3CVP1_9TELE|nr:hypothetical protein AGOR_G00198340 [Albula goreensis]
METPPTPLPRTRRLFQYMETAQFPTTSDTQGGGELDPVYDNLSPVQKPPPLLPKPKMASLPGSPTSILPRDTVDGSSPTTRKPPPPLPRPHWGRTPLVFAEAGKSAIPKEPLKEENEQPPPVPHRGKPALVLPETGKTCLTREPIREETEVTKTVYVNSSMCTKSQENMPSPTLHEDTLDMQIWQKKGEKTYRTYRSYEDMDDLREWFKSMQPWDTVVADNEYVVKDELKVFSMKAERVRKALLLLNDIFLTEHVDNLRNHIIELHSIANNIDKVYRGAKIAGITGGATGAVGVGAAVAGILFAPATMGASLLVTAAGVGAVAVGGATGASAAITNKVNSGLDKKKVEKILKDCMDRLREIDDCQRFISTEEEGLREHSLSHLSGAEKEDVAEVRVAKEVSCSSTASSQLLQDFTQGMDVFFDKKDTQKLKSGSETKFAKKIRMVADELQEGLSELTKIQRKLSSLFHDSYH